MDDGLNSRILHVNVPDHELLERSAGPSLGWTANRVWSIEAGKVELQGCAKILSDAECIPVPAAFDGVKIWEILSLTMNIAKIALLIKIKGGTSALI